MTHSVGQTPQSIAVGDFNNDTYLDVVAVNRYSNDISILFGYGNGSFVTEIAYSIGSFPVSTVCRC